MRDVIVAPNPEEPTMRNRASKTRSLKLATFQRRQSPMNTKSGSEFCDLTADELDLVSGGFGESAAEFLNNVASTTVAVATLIVHVTAYVTAPGH
jgi:hypothetical protein